MTFDALHFGIIAEVQGLKNSYLLFLSAAVRRAALEVR
jgi:hypothetical protein